MPQWRIYFEDGSAFDSDMGVPEDSPVTGIAAIRQHYDCSHHPVSPLIKPESAVYRGSPISANFYVWRPDVGEWIGTVDIFGVIYQAERHGPVLLRQGAMMPHVEWERVWNAANADADFAH